MSTFHTCDRCGARRLLLARILKEMLCSDCWHKANQPWPAPSDDEERFEAETATRKKMIARKGADLHMVRSGRT